MTPERRLRTLFKKWTPRLGLADWDITLELSPDTGMDNTGWEKGFETAAECASHWEYQRATIRFAEAWVVEATDSALEDTVVHELMHVMLNELRREHKMPNEERTAVMLTRAFLRAA